MSPPLRVRWTKEDHAISLPERFQEAQEGAAVKAAPLIRALIRTWTEIIEAQDSPQIKRAAAKVARRKRL